MSPKPPNLTYNAISTFIFLSFLVLVSYEKLSASEFESMQFSSELSECQDRTLSYETRIVACSNVLSNEELLSDFVLITRFARADAYTMYADELRSIGQDIESESISRLAIQDLDLLIRSEFSNLFGVYFLRGKNRLNLQQWESAIFDFTHSLEIFPGVSDVYHYRGRAFVGAGRIDEALSDYERLLAADPPLEIAGSAYLLRIIALCQGNKKDGIQEEIAHSHDRSGGLSTIVIQQTLKNGGIFHGVPESRWSPQAVVALDTWIAADCPFP